MEYFLPMFGVGLATSFHCVSMCGPLVLTYAVKDDDGRVSLGAKLIPHLTYQSAKILSYVLVGLLLGLVGAAFDLAGIRPYIMVLAGLFMVLLGINMTGRIPWLRRLTLRPPAFLVRALSRTRRKARDDAAEGHTSLATPATFGLLTGLMPCGPLQAAQLSAASAGSAAAGAAAMLGFGLGTAPLMLAFGVGSGYLGAAFKKKMNLVAAIVIIVLGLVYLNRGAMLLGSPVTFQSITQAVSGPVPVGEEIPYTVASDGVAEVELKIVNTTFVPSTVQVPQDVPVRLLVDRQEDNACSDEIWLPQLGVRQALQPFAVTAVALPATAAGTYTLTCGMGMMSGTLVVGDAAASAGRPWWIWALAAAALVAVAAWVLRRRPGQGTDSSACDASDGGSAAGRRILGLERGELIVVLAALAAAVIAGLVFGGAFR